MNRMWMSGLPLIFLACAVESPPANPASRLDELESRLLAADTVRFAYRVRADGAVEVELAGNVSIVEDRIEVTGAGHFAGQPVEMFVRGDAGHYEFGNRTTHERRPTPGELREALLIGFTRMGILHNLARLSGAAPPDHADGGVRQWVTADSIGMDPADSASVSFRLTVAGQASGHASLRIDEAGLPVIRHQTVQFPSGEMRVEERYSAVRISP